MRSSRHPLHGVSYFAARFHRVRHRLGMRWVGLVCFAVAVWGCGGDDEAQTPTLPEMMRECEIDVTRQLVRCTDGLVTTCGNFSRDDGEQCDNGWPGLENPTVPGQLGQNSNTTPGACRADCREARCGDGVVDPLLGETCDDGNRIPDDGCTRTCTTGQTKTCDATDERACHALPDCPNQQTDFSDGVLSLDPWNDTAGGVGRRSVRQQDDGGNPGSHRSVDINSEEGCQTTTHLREDAVWDPATQGAPSELRMSFDAAVLGIDPADGIASFSMVAQQSGVLFWTTLVDVNFDDGWTILDQWTAADFVRFDFFDDPDNPRPDVQLDLSVTGAPVQFGFMVAKCGRVTGASVDNWIVRVCH